MGIRQDLGHGGQSHSQHSDRGRRHGRLDGRRNARARAEDRLLRLDWIYDGAATQRDAAIEQDTVRGASKIPGAS